MTALGTEVGLVGRDRELAAIMEAVSRARSGQPTSMIVEGEAGLGKSRLVREAMRRLQVGGMPSVVVATGHGTDVTGDRIPYGVASSILNDLLPHVGPVWPSRVAPRLRSALATLHPAWGSHSAGTPLDRLALVAGFRQLLADLGTTSLVCLVIDDLHWADESSLDLMSLLARGPATPLLLLAAVRPISGEGFGVARHVADLSRRPDGELLTLSPLGEEAVHRYLSAADDGSWGPGTRDQIAVLAQGVPLFLEALSAGADRVGQTLPPTIAALVAARLQTVAPQTRLVLEAAAVRELPVDRRALMAVTGLDRAALATGLQEACAHQLLDPLGGARYRLHHPLVRRAIEESVVERTTERWHHGWATWLADRAEVDATARTSLAHHWFHAGDAEHAITAALDAARAATELDATAEASLHWSRMLELWPVVIDPRRSTGLDRDELIWSYYWALRASGNVEASRDLVTRELALRPPVSGTKLLWLEARRYLESIHGGTDHSDAATGALTWEELLDLVRGVLGGSEPPRPSCWMLGTLGTLLNRALPPDVMTLVAEWLDAMGDEFSATAFLHAPALQVRVYRLVRERRHEDALALARAAEVSSTAIGPNERIRATANVANGLLGLGRFCEAIDHGERALARLGPPDAARGDWLTLAQCVILARVQGGGWGRAHELFAAHLAHPEWHPIGESAGAMALVAAWQGRHQQAREWIDLCVADLPSLTVASELVCYAFQPFLARACLAEVTGDIVGARRHLRPLLASDRLGTDSGDLWQAVLQGARLAGCAGDSERTRREWANLVEQAASQVNQVAGFAPAWLAEMHANLDLADGAKHPEQWAAVASGWADLDMPFREALARVRRATVLPLRSTMDIRAELEQARSLLVPLSAEPALLDVQRLAGQAGLRLGARKVSAAAADRPRLSSLTAREVEVAGLVAEGRTNQQIATALFMAPKTASIHVSRIIAKLGVRNRTEVAALLYRHGLMDR